MPTRSVLCFVVLTALSACFQPVAEDPNVGWRRDTGPAVRRDAGWAREETLGACSDGVDNDGDGEVDCKDPDCWLSCNPPDASLPPPGRDASTPPPGRDASTPPPARDAGCSPVCPTGLCGDDGCGGTCSCSGGQTCFYKKCIDCHTANCIGRQCGDDGCGGTCGTCSAGTTCSGAGQCVRTVCDPPVGPCGADQFCDTSATEPICAEICDPPMGCALGVTCVHDTPSSGHCQLPKCSDESCGEGQLCRSIDGTNEVCTCYPAYVDASGIEQQDTCAAFGKVCGMDLAQPTLQPATCRLPGELEDCKPAVGCAPLMDGGRLDCVALTGSSLCLRSCEKGGKTDATMCRLDYTTCYGSPVKNHCYVNICADPSCTGTPGCKEDTERAKFFKPCTNVTAWDSTCVPYPMGDHMVIGLCVQGGTAAHGGECDPSLTHYEPSPYSRHCPPPQLDSTGAVVMPGEQCQALEWSPTTRGICRPMCNAYSPSPVPVATCGAGQLCLDITLDPLVAKTWLGLCVPQCDLFGAGVCGFDVLGNRMGCTASYDYQGPGWCRAMVDAPSGAGGTCSSPSAQEPRSSCGDRLECLSGECTSWCQSAQCPDPNAPCQACGGRRCVQIGSGPTPVQICEAP
ncbi:MAG: hypothetical protein QM765_33270 [Myxococcales bacterium]